MQRAVKAQVLLTMDMHLQPDQTTYELARTVQHQIDQQLRLHNIGKINKIMVFEGHGDALTLSMREPAVELEGKQGMNGWELVRNDPNASSPRILNLLSGTRSASNPISTIEPPRTGAEDKPWSEDPKLLISRRKRKEKKVVARAARKAARPVSMASSEATKYSAERKFKHEFDDPGFNKQLRKHGLLGAFAPRRVERAEKVRARRSSRDELRRWVAQDNPNEDKKMDIITDELAAAFDFNAPVPTKAELKAARRNKAMAMAMATTPLGGPTPNSTGPITPKPGDMMDIARSNAEFGAIVQSGQVTMM